MEKINEVHGISVVIINRTATERPVFLSEEEVSAARKFHSTIR
ncbi:hypothetical protein [Sedimentibacter sp. B4]|nr:hypothetical protein [Sedimentibacter sp. B4]